MNEFNPSEQEYYKAFWKKRNKDGTYETPEPFMCKEFIKSGRGTSQGQDSISFSPLQGFKTDRKQMNLWTTSSYDFKEDDKVVFNGFKYTIHRVGLDTSSANNIAMSEYGTYQSSKLYLPYIIELGR